MGNSKRGNASGTPRATPSRASREIPWGTSRGTAPGIPWGLPWGMPRGTPRRTLRRMPRGTWEMPQRASGGPLWITSW